MHFDRIEKLALFGGSWLLAALLPKIKSSPWEKHVFTSERHLKDVVTPQKDTLETILKKSEVSFTVAEDINKNAQALEFVDKNTLGIAIGAAWVFESDFAKKFSLSLLDFMGIALPEYRGGAHYTWQILNNHRKGACNLQIVEGGLESFHRGKILKHQEYVFPNSARTPQDFFLHAVPIEVDFLSAFLLQVQAKEEFTVYSLDEKKCSFFPALNTRLNGWINWSWTTSEVERFCCAFDEPYAGASTYLEGKRVHLKGVHAHFSDGSFHPFTSGLIYRKSKDSIFIALKDGAICVQEILDEQGNRCPLEEGLRLYTPTRHLEGSLFPVTYTTRGIQ